MNLGKKSLKVFVVIWLLWVTSLLLTQNSFLRSTIQTYVSDPTFFVLRDTLGLTPPLSKKLKIIALDDQTVGYLGDNEIGLKDLVLLLENIARQRPSAILLDRLFGEEPKGENAQLWLDRMKKIEVPIYSGAYFNSRSIAYRDKLDLSSNQYSYDPDILDQQSVASTSGLAYGYADEYEGVFSSVGHIVQNNGGTFFPVIRYQKSNLVPHLGMYAAGGLLFKERSLFSNRNKVPLDEDGQTVFNYRPMNDYYKISKSLRHMIARARENIIEKNISENDVVIVLFNFYTGSADFFEGGPFGDIPGGFLVATIADSVLSGRWIEKVDIESGLILIAGFLGLLLGLKSHPVRYWGYKLTFVIAYFTFVNYLFSYHSIMLSWVLPLLSFTMSGLVFYVYQRIVSEFSIVQIEKNYYSEKALRLEEENTKIKLKERLNLGRAVQEILLPDSMCFSFDSFKLTMHYQAAQEMSGDWIYVWRINEFEVRVLLGDVVGKGPSAAIPVAVIIGILGECEKLGLSVEEAFSRINDRLIELFSKQITSTCAAISIVKGQSIRFYNAGSPGWFLLQKSGVRHLALRSSSLGITEKNQVALEIIDASELNWAFAFSDGYLEGARAYHRLLKKLSKSDEVDFCQLETTLNLVGKDFRLEDDRSLVAIDCRSN